MDAIASPATLAEVIGLEVEGSLGEAVAVGKVMDGVDDVEGISGGSCEGRRGCSGEVVGVVEGVGR